MNEIKDLIEFQAKARYEDLKQRSTDADVTCLERHGYKVYSQTDEDGILQEIFNRIGSSSKIFVEFGVGGGIENNTRCLLQHFGWKGLWIEPNQTKANQIRQIYSSYIKERRLILRTDFLTKEIMDSVIISSGIKGSIDLLSIDVDGNDYHLWESIQAIQPRVVAIEYSAKYGPHASVVQTYDPEYRYDKRTHIGASWNALVQLARSKGYKPIGSGISGLNAYFCLREIDPGHKLFPKEDSPYLYNPPRLELYYAGAYRNE